MDIKEQASPNTLIRIDRWSFFFAKLFSLWLAFFVSHRRNQRLGPNIYCFLFTFQMRYFQDVGCFLWAVCWKKIVRSEHLSDDTIIDLVFRTNESLLIYAIFFMEGKANDAIGFFNRKVLTFLNCSEESEASKHYCWRPANCWAGARTNYV